MRHAYLTPFSANLEAKTASQTRDHLNLASFPLCELDTRKKNGGRKLSVMENALLVLKNNARKDQSKPRAALFNDGRAVF